MEPDQKAPVYEVEPKARGGKLPVILGGILIVLAIVTTYYYFEVRALEKDPAKVNQEKVLAIVAKVGKLIDLPEGEVPSAATITDPAPLAGNPFFANAKAGDEVLLYTVASKAFLYDPVKNMVVEVATINLGK